MKCLHYFVEYCWCWIEFRYSFVFGYECVNTRANREFHSRALLSFLTSANVIRAQGNFNKSWKNSIILHRLEMREREAWRAVGSIKWSRSRLTFYHYLLATRRGWLHVAWRRDRLGSVPSSPTSLKALSLSLSHCVSLTSPLPISSFLPPFPPPGHTRKNVPSLLKINNFKFDSLH